MSTANVHEAKTNLSKLLDAAERGEQVFITRRGSGVNRFALVPVPLHPRSELFGALRGQIVYSDDYDSADAAIAAIVRRALTVPLLFDTNALLWLLDGDDRLGSKARHAVVTADTLVVSVASLWEIAIEISVGKLAPIPGLHTTLLDRDFERLDIADAHLVALETLPMLHRDPFDRLLVCQALADGLTVLTADEMFAPYGVAVRDARR